MAYFIKQCTLEVNLTISRYDQMRRNVTKRDATRRNAMLRTENRAKFRRAPPPKKCAAGSIPVDIKTIYLLGNEN